MDLGSAIPVARARSGLTLRALAHRAHTSHATLSAYESGRVDPGARVVERVVRAAGYRITVELEPTTRTTSGRHPGDELVEILTLAEHLPRRARARRLTGPVFPTT